MLMSDLRTLRDRPMELLQALERRFKETAEHVVAATGSWAGVAIRLGDQRFLVPQDQVSEVVELSGLSRVPGSKPWLMGVSNIRGELIPVININDLLLDGVTALDLNSRILVLKHDHYPAGFLVDRVEGLRRFDLSQKKKDTGVELPPACQAFITGGYGDENAVLPVLSLHKLVDDPIFQMAA